MNDERGPAKARSGQLRCPDDAARAEIDDLARRADRVTSLLLYSDLPEIDIDIAINELREFCRRHFPDRMELFGMVYESRWRRFREQGWARLPYRQTGDHGPLYG
jgi:hypothetical protein